jgi:hypothetical protein
LQVAELDDPRRGKNLKRVNWDNVDARGEFRQGGGEPEHYGHILFIRQDNNVICPKESTLSDHLANLRIGGDRALYAATRWQTKGTDCLDATGFQAISELRTLRSVANQNHTPSFDPIRQNCRLKPRIKKRAYGSNRDADADYLGNEGTT